MDKIYNYLDTILGIFYFYYEKTLVSENKDAESSALFQAVKIEAYCEILRELDPVRFEDYERENANILSFAK